MVSATDDRAVTLPIFIIDLPIYILKGPECGGRRSGGEVLIVVETCGTNLKTINVHKAMQNKVSGIKKKS